MNTIRLNVRLMYFIMLLFSWTVMGANTKVTAVVTDFDTGDPIENADVVLSVNTTIKAGYGWGSGRPNRYSRKSDAAGKCVLRGEGNGGFASVSVTKEGYYGASGHKVEFTGTSGILGRRWLPWNPTVDVQLKKIGKQIPLYARRFWDLELPAVNEPIGFDLMVSDWVPPHGKGKHADLVFRMDREPEKTIPIEKVGRYGRETKELIDVKLTVSGSKEGDGFILVPITPVGKGPSSRLRMPREAPKDGYQDKVERRRHNTPDGPLVDNTRDDANYFFRVRTVKNENGDIVSALYGKIHGDFEFRAREPFEIKFTYYLNPTPNDRNLEFEKNLLKDLSDLENIRGK